MKKIWILCLTIISCVFAQDEGLYAPAPPADGAFVRVVHAFQTAPSTGVTVGDTAYGDL